MLAISLAWIASSEHTRPRSIGVYPNNRRRELPPQSERIGPRRLRQRLTCFFSDAQRCGRQRIGRWRCRESAVIWASLEARQSTVFYPIAGSLFPERAGCIPASTRFQDVQIRTANRNAKPAISDNAIRIASRNGSSASLSGCFVMGQATGSALQRRTGEIATAQNGVAARRHGATCRRHDARFTPAREALLRLRTAAHTPFSWEAARDPRGRQPPTALAGRMGSLARRATAALCATALLPARSVYYVCRTPNARCFLPTHDASAWPMAPPLGVRVMRLRGQPGRCQRSLASRSTQRASQ